MLAGKCSSCNRGGGGCRLNGRSRGRGSGGSRDRWRGRGNPKLKEERRDERKVESYVNVQYTGFAIASLQL